MSGRYVLRKKPKTFNSAIWRHYWYHVPVSKPLYNIGPHPHKTTSVLINTIGKKLVNQDMLWGVHTSWSKSALINAKVESIKNSKLWKPLAAMRPCLIPADGFYLAEEQIRQTGSYKKNDNKTSPAEKRTWHGVEFTNRQAFFMAGFWKPGDESSHYVLLTREANDSLKSINTRVPVIFTESQAAAAQLWMDTEMNFDKRLAVLMEDQQTTQNRHQNSDIHTFKVGHRVKNLGNDGPELFQAEANSE